MLKIKFLVLTFLIAAVAHGKDAAPNFLIIVADDLGYSDLGAFGGEISTPNLDALANAGVRLSNFHVAPACAPTRAMLLTGADNHQVGLGTMVAPTAEQKLAPGYVEYLLGNIPTIAERLRDAGYDTLMAGKWHLGRSVDKVPASFGFNHSFTLLPGAASHFGVDQGKDLKNYDPETFRKNRRAIYFENDNPVEYPTGSHSTDVYTKKMLGYLQNAVKNEQPFFAYLAYTAPHWPLQVPENYLDKYRGRYDQGPHVLQEERLRALKKLGLVDKAVVPHPMVDVPAWESLSKEERAVLSRKMEIYAAMVDHMDDRIGQVVQFLKRNNRYDNTYILFMSDNGAEAQLTEALGGDPYIEPDNGLTGLGKANSFAAYERGWPQAGTTPFRMYKAYSTEGGVRAPAFVTGPKVASSGIKHAFTHVTDVVPTLLDLAGIAQPPQREGAVNIRGKSWVPLLAGKASQVYADDEPVGGELFGGRYLYKGTWKATYVQNGYYHPKTASAGEWQLYNIRKDPGETNDLSDEHPQILKELVDDWYRYAEETDVVVLWDEREREASSSKPQAANSKL